MSVCPAQEPGARPRAILNFEQVQPLVMRVLIVEDDNALADGLMRTLRQSGYAVDHAESGELALRACAEEHYDLVVLDVSLPGIDVCDVQLGRLADPQRHRSVYLAAALQAPRRRNQDSHGARIRLHGRRSGCSLAFAGISPIG